MSHVTPSSPAIRILLVDDHAIVREGLKRLLEPAPDLVVVEEAASGPHALERLRRGAVDVVVADITMPGMSGIDLIGRIRAEFPGVAVLVLSMHAEEPYALRAFQAGAAGYLTKDTVAGELIGAIRKVASGGAYVTPSLAERMVLSISTTGGNTPAHATLSNREMQILRLIVAGKRINEIAQELNLSVKTVSTHKSNTLRKLNLPSLAALIRYGLEHQLAENAIPAQKT